MNRSFYAIVLMSVVLCTGAFAMGGAPAPEDNRQIEVKTTQSATPVTDRVTELDKARADMKMEKAELQKLEKNLWLIDTRLVDARKKGDTKRLLTLKQQEQDTIEKARLVQASIARRLEKYPELKVSEAIEKGNAAKPSGNVPAAPVVLPVPKAPAPIAAAPKPVETGNIIIHTVQPGDTLFSLSRKYFGTPSLYKDIARMNNLLPNEGLYVGMKIKIDQNLKGVVMKKPVVQQQSRPVETAPVPIQDLPQPVDDLNL